jgi:hypothetical protein
MAILNEIKDVLNSMFWSSEAQNLFRDLEYLRQDRERTVPGSCYGYFDEEHVTCLEYVYKISRFEDQYDEALQKNLIWNVLCFVTFILLSFTAYSILKLLMFVLDPLVSALAGRFRLTYNGLKSLIRLKPRREELGSGGFSTAPLRVKYVPSLDGRSFITEVLDADGVSLGILTNSVVSRHDVPFEEI